VLADTFGESGIGVLLDIDANQWHGKAPQGKGTHLTLDQVGQIERIGRLISAHYLKVSI
jgi:hypothetical protein